MHHGAAGEVHGVNLGPRVPDAVHRAVDAPDRVALGEVNDEHPEGHENKDGLELHAFRAEVTFFIIQQIMGLPTQPEIASSFAMAAKRLVAGFAASTVPEPPKIM